MNIEEILLNPAHFFSQWLAKNDFVTLAETSTEYSDTVDYFLGNVCVSTAKDTGRVLNMDLEFDETYPQKRYKLNDFQGSVWLKQKISLSKFLHYLNQRGIPFTIRNSPVDREYLFIELSGTAELWYFLPTEQLLKLRYTCPHKTECV